MQYLFLKFMNMKCTHEKYWELVSKDKLLGPVSFLPLKTFT